MDSFGHKPNNPNSIPRIHMVAERTPTSCPLTSISYGMIVQRTHIYRAHGHTKKYRAGRVSMVECLAGTVKLWIGLGEDKPQAQINTQKENVTQEAQAERSLGWCSVCLKRFDPSIKEINMV